MYMRLWWKDARQFWSIWVFLGLAAAAGQWVALNTTAPSAGKACWAAMALAWSGVYAVAVGCGRIRGRA